MGKEDQNEPTGTHVVLTEGAMVPPYRIIRQIGVGGMGEVYLADDTRLNRRVAIKFLPTHLASKEDVKNRFYREAQSVAKLNHPNIVTIHDVSEFHGRPYFVMEHIEGESLHHYAHDEPLPIDKIIEYAIQISQGLGEAHRAGIIHRDIKAANIAIDKKGRARLLDFGLAAVKGDDKLTRTGTTLGTVSYMSPEQVSGREVDHRSDLFSFGIVLYELIAGRTPFKRDSEGATLKAIVEDTPEPLSRYKSDVPERLQQIVSKLLEKDKELRYQSAEDIIADLKRLMYDSQPTAAYNQSFKKKSNKLGLKLGIAGAVILVLATVLTIVSGLTGTKETKADSMPMIAVLPFDNLGAAEDEYFADGITEEITSRLAVVEGLGVISRTSANKYKSSNKSLEEIGRELGVDYVLQGTVRWSKIGDRARVRITPQLTQVESDRSLWASNYERELMEVFAVQADIAMQIVDQLGLALLDHERDELQRKLTDNPEAYAYYLKAVSFIRDPDMRQQEARQIIDLLDSALMLDPAFALAYAKKSITHSWCAFGLLDALAGEEGHDKLALECAKKAMEIEPGLPEGHLALGIYYNLVNRDYDRALEEFSIAESNLHNNPELFASIAYVHWRQGRFEEAQKNFQKSIELDPLTALHHYSLAECLNFTRDYENALKAIDRAIILQPDRATYYNSKISILLNWHGDLDEIRAVIDGASKYIEPVEIISQGYWQYNLVDISLDSLISYFETVRVSNSSDVEYYSTMAMTYMSANQSSLMAAYCDSASRILEDKIKQAPDEYGLRMGMGLAQACLGNYERAIEEGKLAKELMSVSSCHW